MAGIDDSFFILSAMAELFAAFVLLVLLCGCLSERSSTGRVDKLFIALLVTQIALLASDSAVMMLPTMPQPHISLTKALTLLVDTLIAVMAALYTYFQYHYISARRKVSPWFCRIIIAICAALTVMWVVCLFNNLYISYDSLGAEHAGPLYFFTKFITFLMVASNMVYTFVHHRILGWRDTAILMSYGVLPLSSMAFGTELSITPSLLAMTLSLLMLYVIIHIQQTRRAAEQELQLMQQKLQIAQQELELTDSRTRIMLSQLQPHFLYNVLNSIYHLCGMNPTLAQNMVEHFSDYLRNNMASIEQTGLIPFPEEYQHIQTYLSLERIRFPKTLDVVYNIEATNFRLPPLTIQPLVENAVRHGVTKKRGGGAVTLSTCETADSFVITVADTGRGFDPEHYAEDGQIHIGINSVRERLRTMCGGTLRIESELNRGTTATVTIPKNEEDSPNENHSS